MSLDAGSIAASAVYREGLLVGSWFSAITWGVEAFQFAVYLTRFTKDSIVLKSAVIFIFCADTAWNVMFFVGTYFHLITVEPYSLASFVPTMPLASASIPSATVIFGVNLFLIYRYRKLTQRTWFSIFLLTVTLASYGCHLWATAVALSVDITELAEWAASPGGDQAEHGAKAGLALEVTMVCSIWLLLLFHFLSLLRQEMQDVRRVIKRLVIVTLESGTCASAVAIATLIIYLRHPSSTNPIVVGFFISRVYFMTMLFNLNMRGSGGLLMRDVRSQSRVPHLPGGPVDSNDVQLAHLQSLAGGVRSGIQHSVVHVSQSVATHVDQEKGYGSKVRDPEDHL